MVLLYDDQPSWHNDLDETIKKFERNDFGATVVDRRHIKFDS